MSPARIQTWTLPPQQGRSQYLKAGTLLLVQRGRLQLTEAPRWLADQPLPMQHTLHEGQAWQLAESGWVQLHSGDQPAVLRVEHEAAAPQGARAAAWWRRLPLLRGWA